MRTPEELDKNIDTVCVACLKVERQRIIDAIRIRAEEHPKWECHDLLQSLADDIEAEKV